MSIINSDDYHDYVIKNGKLIREFEQMYQKSRDVPWHQDKDPERLDCRIALSILGTKAPYESILDIGCGLGYFTNEISKSCLKGGSIVGIDISSTAIAKARRLFPHIRFEVLDITKNLDEQGWGEARFKLLVIRGLFWYVFPETKEVCRNISHLADSNGYILIQQNFPPLSNNFVGKGVLPNPDTLLSYFKSDFHELVANYLEDNKQQAVNDNWIYMFGMKKE